jgi:hypothetical protein
MHPIDNVIWQALTDPARKASALMPGMADAMT